MEYLLNDEIVLPLCNTRQFISCVFWLGNCVGYIPIRRNKHKVAAAGKSENNETNGPICWILRIFISSARVVVNVCVCVVCSSVRFSLFNIYTILPVCICNFLQFLAIYKRPISLVAIHFLTLHHSSRRSWMVLRSRNVWMRFPSHDPQDKCNFSLMFRFFDCCISATAVFHYIFHCRKYTRYRNATESAFMSVSIALVDCVMATNRRHYAMRCNWLLCAWKINHSILYMGILVKNRRSRNEQPPISRLLRKNFYRFCHFPFTHEPDTYSGLRQLAYLIPVYMCLCVSKLCRTVWPYFLGFRPLLRNYYNDVNLYIFRATRFISIFLNGRNIFASGSTVTNSKQCSLA